MDKQEKEKEQLKPLWADFQYKSHQVSGIKWMLEREAGLNPGGLLCDEMGLGKTMEVLGTIKNSKKAITLLLCPKAVIQQWCDAATKSKFNVMELAGERWSRTSPLNPAEPWLYVTNYEKLRKSVFHYNWDRIVLDEAQRIRNANSSAYKAVNSLKRKALWAVSATPIVNKVKDIINLFALVGYDGHKLANSSYLNQAIEEACIHRSMDEMRHKIHDLPAAPTIIKEALDFNTEEEGDFYRSVQGKIAARWKHIENDLTNEKFVLITRLRQLSLHPQVYIAGMKRRSVLGYPREDWVEPSTKFVALRKKLEKSPAAKWIVFCQFHDEMEILQAYLMTSPAVFKVSQYHGGMTDSQKQEVLSGTKGDLPQTEKRHEILLLQLQSGGVGLNLQHFTKIVFMSPWWTAALMDQAVGRAVRIGQKEIVEVTMLLLKEEETMNIDEMMIEKAESKRSILISAFQHASRGIEEEEDPSPI